MTAQKEMTFGEALRLLDPAALASCYFVYGEERFFVDQILRWFRENGVTGESADFNYHRFEGDRVLLSSLLLVARSYPLNAPRRMVVLTDADKVKDDEGLLLTYLNAPTPTTVIIFVARKLEIRTKLFLTLTDRAVRIHCRPMYGTELPRFIRQEADRRGLSLTDDAVSFFKEYWGHDPFRIQNGLEKLSLLLGKGSVSRERVEPIVSFDGEGRDHSIFEFLAAVGEKDLKKALPLLSSLLVAGEPPLIVLTMLVKHFRKMATAKEALLSESAPLVGKRLSILPGRLPAFLNQLRGWQEAEIQSAFRHFLWADGQLKGGSLAPPAVLARLIMGLCPSPLWPLPLYAGRRG